MKKLLCLVMILALTLALAVTASAEEPVKLTFSSWGDAA